MLCTVHFVGCKSNTDFDQPQLRHLRFMRYVLYIYILHAMCIYVCTLIARKLLYKNSRKNDDRLFYMSIVRGL